MRMTIDNHKGTTQEELAAGIHAWVVDLGSVISQPAEVRHCRSIIGFHAAASKKSHFQASAILSDRASVKLLANGKRF